MPLPAQCLPFIGTRVKERKRERENRRKEGEEEEEREENTGPICFGWYEDVWKGGHNSRGVEGQRGGGLWGGRVGRWTVGREGRGEACLGLWDVLGGGVKYQSVVVLCQSTVGPQWPATRLLLMSLGWAANESLGNQYSLKWARVQTKANDGNVFLLYVFPSKGHHFKTFKNIFRGS